MSWCSCLRRRRHEICTFLDIVDVLQLRHGGCYLAATAACCDQRLHRGGIGSDIDGGTADFVHLQHVRSAAHVDHAMNTEQAGGIARALVPAIVAWMVGRGWIPAGAAGDVGAAILAVVAAGWSVQKNTQSAQIAAVAS